ncbi:hypothetical protein AVEN_103568-1 [Araneus ventricosus]|uniref:Uncharacterized protein n=1 Tax=Araneus ventricosus TaxID=182803 RepID=A0A4Y2G442_ARAVE|nr:hypothetical protein AVEN_103568-1 [Araneus ventricosus]
MTTPELASPLQNSTPHQREGVCTPTYDFTCNRPIYTADLWCNRVSNLEPSGPEAETLLLSYRGPSSSSDLKPQRGTALKSEDFAKRMHEGANTNQHSTLLLIP